MDLVCYGLLVVARFNRNKRERVCGTHEETVKNVDHNLLLLLLRFQGCFETVFKIYAKENYHFINKIILTYYFSIIFYRKIYFITNI